MILTDQPYSDRMAEPDPFHEQGFDMMAKLIAKYFDFTLQKSNIEDLNNDDEKEET